jgi:hypothetical protein
MMAIMTIGLISYGASLVFYAAAFPSLRWVTPHTSIMQLNHNLFFKKN